MTRQCYRLDKVAIKFENLKAGDLFVLEDPPMEKVPEGPEPPREDGTVINLALGAPTETEDGNGNPTHGIQSEEVGLTCAKPKEAEAMGAAAAAWMATALQHVGNEEYLRNDRNHILQLVFDNDAGPWLRQELYAQGYHRLIGLPDPQPVIIRPGEEPVPLIGGDKVKVFVELREDAEVPCELAYCFDSAPNIGVPLDLLLSLATHKFENEGLAGAMRIPDGLEADAFLVVGSLEEKLEELKEGLEDEDGDTEDPEVPPAPSDG